MVNLDTPYSLERPIHMFRSLRLNNAGFTIIELMTVIAILGIMIVLAAPSLQQFMVKSRVASTTNELVGSLQYARSEAIKRAQTVTLCKTEDPIASEPACSTANGIGWDAGWVIFVDANSNSAWNKGETILRRVQPSSTGGSIVGNNNLKNVLSYGVNGYPKATDDFILCISGQQRTINLSTLGRVTIKAGVC